MAPDARLQRQSHRRPVRDHAAVPAQPGDRQAARPADRHDRLGADPRDHDPDSGAGPHGCADRPADPDPGLVDGAGGPGAGGLMNPGPLGRALWWCGDRYEALTSRLFAARGLAALRVGYGTLWVLFLLREWGERDLNWGPDASWSPALARQY